MQHWLLILPLLACAHAPRRDPVLCPACPEPEETEKVIVRWKPCPLTEPPALPQLTWADKGCPPAYVGCLDAADAGLLQRFLRETRAWADDAVKRCGRAHVR